MTKITINDARKAGFCVAGLRDFAEKHNLDLRDFVKNGIEESVLIDLGEAGIVDRIREVRAKEESD